MKPLELGMLLRYIKSVFVGILLVFPYLNVNAQQMETVDYTGAITKFDTQFDGIGPRVYLLPHPPSQHDLIDSAFLRKEAIGLDPHSALVKMFFLTNLKATTQVLGPWSALPKHTGPKQSAEGWLIQEMDRVKPLQNTNYLADLQNLLACEYARIGLTELAIFLKPPSTPKANSNCTPKLPTSASIWRVCLLFNKIGLKPNPSLPKTTKCTVNMEMCKSKITRACISRMPAQPLDNTMKPKKH
jgi:hypothetical protein